MMVSNMRARMHKFVSGLSPKLVLKSKRTLLIGDMNISRLLVCMQQAEEEKKK